MYCFNIFVRNICTLSVSEAMYINFVLPCYLHGCSLVLQQGYELSCFQMFSPGCVRKGRDGKCLNFMYHTVLTGRYMLCLCFTYVYNLLSFFRLTNFSMLSCMLINFACRPFLCGKLQHNVLFCWSASACCLTLCWLAVAFWPSLCCPTSARCPFLWWPFLSGPTQQADFLNAINFILPSFFMLINFSLLSFMLINFSLLSFYRMINLSKADKLWQTVFLYADQLQPDVL